MSTKPYPPETLPNAQAVLEAWRKIDPALMIGDLALSALEAELAQVGPLQSEMDALDAQLTDVRNRRDALFVRLWDKVKRVRAAVKGIYGDDSSQYEMVGGTRLSERKPPTRKAKA